MVIRDLEWFLQLAKTGSFTDAAKVLDVTQPTLSRAIQKLERDMDVQLVIRTQNGIKLTESGAELRRRIEPVLQELHSIQDAVKCSANLVQIRVGITPMISVMFMAPLIADLKRRHPEIQFTFYEGGTENIRKKLSDGLLDIGIGLYTPGEDPILKDTLLLEDKMVVYMRADNPLAQKNSLCFEDLRHETFNLYDTSFLITQQVRSRCLAANFSPKFNLQSSRAYFLMQMSAYGSGVCVLPRLYGALFMQPNMQMLPIENYPWQCALICCKDIYTSHGVQVVKDYLVSSFAIIAKDLAEYPDHSPLELPCIKNWCR